jgi:hypothetical protein
MKTDALIRYTGIALEQGKMDVYKASENMIAFSEFMDVAVKATYGESAVAKTEVSGFKHGSFATSMIITIGHTATIFTALSPDQLWSVIQDAFNLWKFLKEFPPKEVQNNGNTCKVTNNYGEILQVQAESVNLVFNEKASNASTKFINNGLRPEGFEGLEIIGNNGSNILTISKQEASCFKKLTSMHTISDNTNRMIVYIITAAFQDDNKWRLSDGERSFSAALLDSDFLTRINNGERFGKGDILDVDMRVLQNLDGTKTIIERSILKVHRHLTPQDQPQLL